MAAKVQSFAQMWNYPECFREFCPAPPLIEHVLMKLKIKAC
jgi:hypothetical protein